MVIQGIEDKLELLQIQIADRICKDQVVDIWCGDLTMDMNQNLLVLDLEGDVSIFLDLHMDEKAMLTFELYAMHENHIASAPKGRYCQSYPFFTGIDNIVRSVDTMIESASEDYPPSSSPAD